jgi:hypothetical protein
LRALAVALVNVGEHERAAQVVEELLTIEPELTIFAVFARIPVPIAAMAQIYATTLKAAGLPE